MTTLMKHGADSDLLREVRDQARELYERAASGPLAGRVSPSRAELDAVWAIVPGPDLEWARNRVAVAMDRAREAGTIATPQVGHFRNIRAV